MAVGFFWISRRRFAPFAAFNEDLYFMEKNKNALKPGIILKNRHLIWTGIDQRGCRAFAGGSKASRRHRAAFRRWDL